MAEELIAGRYNIQDELGRGASATVFRARDTVLDRNVALKVIASSLASDPEFTWRFEQEARLAARLDHPNIVTVHDVGTLPDGRAFIAMRLLEGKSLDKLMAERGQMTPNEVVNIVDQLAMALDYTHAAGLVHRDVKPSNVTIDSAGRATLTDFGIARALDSARVTLPGLTIGTPRYMSPEQVRGEDTTPATDEYSLAVMAYEMMAGRPPFEGDGTALMYKIVHESAPPPNAFNPWLPATVAEVLQRALSKVPGERWPSSGEFARALREALATSTLRGAALPGAHNRQTTVVSTPPTAVYSTGPNPVPPLANPSGGAAPIVAAAAAAGAVEAAAHARQTGSEPALATGSAPAAEPEEKKPTTIIPPVILPDSGNLTPPAITPVEPLPQPVAPQTIVSAPPPSSERLAAPPPEAAEPATVGMGAGGPPGDPPSRRTGLMFGGLAALAMGAAGLGAFLLLGGGGDDDNSAERLGDHTPTASATASATTAGVTRTPTVTVGPGTPTPTPVPEQATPTQGGGGGGGPTPVPPANATATSVPPTNTNVPPTNTAAPPTRTNTPVPPTATNTTAAGFYARITAIKIENGRYSVYFDTNAYNTPKGDHVHFYFYPTVSHANAGNPGGGPWYVYYGNGLFTGYAVSDRPSSATQICVVTADGSHYHRLGTGSCWDIPKE